MPLVSSQGPGSQIAWRGNLDEYPDEFIFTTTSDIQPGLAGTSNAVTITGINYKALITAVGFACSVRVTPYDDDTQTYGSPGLFLPGNDPLNPIIIRNNFKVELQIDTDTPTDQSDYNKSYPVDVNIGKRSGSWLLQTDEIDDEPVPFTFNDLDNQEILRTKTSNLVTVTGIDSVLGVDATIVSSTGELIINGGTPERSGTIRDGDTLELTNTTSVNYSTPVTTTVRVGQYETDFVITTRAADTTVNSFSFTTLIDKELNTLYESNTITLSGADNNVQGNNLLPISITNGEYKVVRNGQNITNFTSSSGTVQNGDQITLRVRSSTEEAQTETATITVSNITATFSVVTEQPIETIPDQFNFVDQTGVDRNSIIESNTITLSGMSFGRPEDIAEATISSSHGTAQFQVTRNGSIVRNYGTSAFDVINGDQIKLRLTSSSQSLANRSATFAVAGRNADGIPGSVNDVWNVRSAQRICTINSFSLTDRTNIEPGTLLSDSFVATGFDGDCGVIATTSDSNSYLKIGSLEGNSLTVNNGDTVEVYMTCPYYDQTRSTTVTLTSSTGTTQSDTWTITPVAPPLPEISLTADPLNVAFLGDSDLLFTYNFVTNSSVQTTSNYDSGTTITDSDVLFNLSTIPINTLSGERSGSYQVQDLAENITYTITVSNSTGSATASVNVLVGSPPNPTVTLCPSNTRTCSNTSSIETGNSITLYWKSTNALSVTSPDFNTNNVQNGNITVTPTQDGQVYTVTATSVEGTTPATATHTINLNPSVTLTASSTSVTTGESITLSWTSVNATSVVNSNGFNANGQLNGSTTVSPPSGTTVYNITVIDNDGIQRSDSVSVTAANDTTVNSFRMNPESISDQQLSSTVTSRPRFLTGPSDSVSGLSPGVTVTARVSGGTFSSGGTSKNVSNGTPSSDLEISVVNSFKYFTIKTATLSIGSVSADFSTRTVPCIVTNGSFTLDGITYVTRTAKLATSRFRRFDTLYKSYESILSIPSSSSFFNRNDKTVSYEYYFISETTGSNITIPGYTIPPSSSGSNYPLPIPSYVTEVRAIVIGAGGGGGADGIYTGGGGGAGGYADVTKQIILSENPGTIYVRVGKGGDGGTTVSDPEDGDGSDSVVSIQLGTTILSTGGGGGGANDSSFGGGTWIGGGGFAGRSSINGTVNVTQSLTGTSNVGGPADNNQFNGNGGTGAGPKCPDGPDAGYGTYNYTRPNNSASIPAHGDGGAAGPGLNLNGQVISSSKSSATLNGQSALSTRYGAGGGGSGQENGGPSLPGSLSGGDGQDGAVKITLKWRGDGGNSFNEDWIKVEVASAIRDEFWNLKKRPPSINEFQNCYNAFKNNPDLYPNLNQQFRQKLVNDYAEDSTYGLQGTNWDRVYDFCENEYTSSST